jgi:hypothetical protein
VKALHALEDRQDRVSVISASQSSASNKIPVVIKHRVERGRLREASVVDLANAILVATDAELIRAHEHYWPKSAVGIFKEGELGVGPSRP